MEKVLGIGGFFFRAQDPEALMQWYTDKLGILPPPGSYDVLPWFQAAGPTVFAPYPATPPAEGKPVQHWMLNLRVRDLDAMAAQLRSQGVEVTIDPEIYPNGRFARIADPEGNQIELWEPSGIEASV